YGTNNEFGFDYLRDNMALAGEQVAQRGHFFAIVDEVDSILIDEARTPLIISAPDADSSQWYGTFARLAPRLKENEDYNIDEKRKAVLITEEGVRKVEQWLGIGNLYEEGLRLVHYLEQSLRARVLFQRDRDYIARDGEIIIVDEFTGRLMPGRRWSDGLHQAVEAKEGVKVQAESRTLATITFQNYFRMYEKLAGMTGTAVTSAEEFHKVYGLEVLVIPTHKPMIRQDRSDLVFRSAAGKWKALVAAVREKYERGQPVLIGTTSIEKNELLSTMLSREGIRHELLNAKHHEREGAIIAQAGRLGGVTVATNMAGRGVDIILGGNPPDPTEAQKVREAGGLAVFGTERHEARRIDNQLRGRAGRQGDQGESQFYLSLEDDLLRIFGGERLKGLMARFDLPEEQPIESGLISKAIESAQGRIEGQNFDIRKHLLDYDDVSNKHREAIYRRRRKALQGEDALPELHQLFQEELKMVCAVHLAGDYPTEWNTEEFTENLKALLPLPSDAHTQILAIAERGEVAGLTSYGRTVTVSTLQDAVARREGILEWGTAVWEQAVSARRDEIGEETLRALAKQVLLRAIDTLWVEHLETMEALRDAVRLRAYGQRDPLVEYKTEAARTIRQLEAAIRARAIQMLFRAHVHPQHSPMAAQAGPPSVPRSGPAAGQQIRKSTTPGRNDPCPCGAINPATGRVYKYKQCGLINAPQHRG
ncbi:MAG: preprotein translocase subunit SecA, partial [Candidatus Terrybacteria bacterium]|nr:preprotein translocase subunit SecA [Candidatus Terrybacteria bacterium]